MGERPVLGRPVGSWVTLWCGLLPALTSKPQFIPASLFSSGPEKGPLPKVYHLPGVLHCTRNWFSFGITSITSFHPHNTSQKSILLLPPFYNKNWPIDGQDSCPRDRAMTGALSGLALKSCSSPPLCWPGDPVLVSCQMVDLQDLPFTEGTGVWEFWRILVIRAQVSLWSPLSAHLEYLVHHQEVWVLCTLGVSFIGEQGN